jgi:hypothetical protein
MPSDKARTSWRAQSFQLGQEKARRAAVAGGGDGLRGLAPLQGRQRRRPEAKLGLAEAYRHLNRQRDAIPLLTQITRVDLPDKELQDDALYTLAHCQTEIQAWNDAKNAWRRSSDASPTRTSPRGKLELAQLTQMH